MGKIIRDDIEYSGLSDYIPDDVNAFNCDIFENKIIIIKEKASIKSIVKCHCNVKIENINIVENIGFMSEEFSYKCNIKGNIYSRCEYISKSEKNYVYTNRAVQPFSICILLKNFYGKRKKIIPSIFIEDIFAEKIDDRSYIISSSLLAIVE